MEAASEVEAGRLIRTWLPSLRKEALGSPNWSGDCEDGNKEKWVEEIVIRSLGGGS